MVSAIPFVLGLVIGSFLNVVGLRFHSGRGLTGRSACPTCGKKLHWYELVPVLSYVFLKGRCYGCKSRISLQYPLVELLTGLIFMTLFIEFGLTTYYLLFTTVFCIYIAILIYDARHKIIPNSLVYPAIVLSLGFGIYRFVFNLDFGIWDFVSAVIIFTFFALIWLVSGGRAMGFGDAKLGLSIGLLLGAPTGASAIVLAFWIGTAVSIIYMIFGRKKLTMKSEIPFAPFMILGAWLALIYGLNLLQIPL